MGSGASNLSWAQRGWLRAIFSTHEVLCVFFCCRLICSGLRHFIPRLVTVPGCERGGRGASGCGHQGRQRSQDAADPSS